MTNPLLSQTIPLAYEVDRPSFVRYSRWLDSGPNDVLSLIPQVLVLRGHELTIQLYPWINRSPCWKLRVDGLTASASEGRKAAWKIAEEIFLLPAAFYDVLPLHYDESFVQLHRKELIASCQFAQPSCIRPGHLQICTRSHTPIRTSLTLEELEALYIAALRPLDPPER